jgi:hypothetical protein
VLISDVWAAQWGSKVVCLKCLEHLNAKSVDVAFQTGRTLWDNVALALALVPFTVIFWPLGFITAPAAVLLGLWHWNTPRSLVSGGRLRLILAVGIGLVEIGLVVLLFALGMTSHSSGHH